MKALLTAAALLAFMPAVHAQDKAAADFTHSAEFRVRDTFEQNESMQTTKPTHHNGILQRLKLGFGYKANEKFSLTTSLIQTAAWGQAGKDGAAPIQDTGRVNGTAGTDQENFLSVNEAYASWMMSDDFSAKFGRMNYSFGDGSVMSINDWQALPYSFDGLSAKYEAAFGRFNFFAFKYRDLSGSFGTAATSDPQHDAYGLVFDLKNMPEMLKMVNAYIIQDVQDGIYGATGNTVQDKQNQNALRFGALGSFVFSSFDLKAQYNMVQGKNADVSGTGTVTERKINQYMMAIEAGFNMPNVMASRFYVGYHRDSGTSGGDIGKNDNTYDPYFYDKHNGSGAMEIIGWGNLTDLYLGWTANPSDATSVGLAYHMFSRTSSDDLIHCGTYGPTTTITAGNTDAATGNEIDATAEHKYDGGLSMMARLGYFTPGAGLKNHTPGGAFDQNVTQVMIQGKLTF